MSPDHAAASAAPGGDSRDAEATAAPAEAAAMAAPEAQGAHSDLSAEIGEADIPVLHDIVILNAAGEIEEVAATAPASEPAPAGAEPAGVVPAAGSEAIVEALVTEMLPALEARLRERLRERLEEIARERTGPD